MSDQIPAWYVEAYKSNVELLLQQEGSRFKRAVRTGSSNGKGARVVQQVGAVVAREKTTRHADTPLIMTPHDSRWAHPKTYEWADLVDWDDLEKVLTDPQSTYAVNASHALERACDDEIIRAFFATARTGEDGTTSTAFPTATQQIVHGSAGLTVSKLLEAKRKLKAAEVDTDRDPIFCAISAEQEEDLLRDASLNSTMTIQSGDFNSDRPLVTGDISRFLGVNFILSERLDVASNIRSCPMWAMSGMHLEMWKDVSVQVDRRPDKSNAIQVYACAMFGATRLEEEKVVEIQCDES